MHSIAAWLEDALGREPTDEHAILYLSNVKMRLGESAEAERLLNALLKIRPKHARAEQGLSAVRHQRWRAEGSVEGTAATGSVGIVVFLVIVAFVTLWFGSTISGESNQEPYKHDDEYEARLRWLAQKTESPAVLAGGCGIRSNSHVADSYRQAGVGS